jgi:hypothetical protein
MTDAQIDYEGQGGAVIPGKTQLPGSSSDWHTVQNYASIKSKKGQVVFGSPKIPLVQFGEINLSKWQYEAEIKKPHIYSWVMNNYWFTNFRAYQEGGFNWQYYITSTNNSSPDMATRIGWNTAMPLQARVLTPSPMRAGSQITSTLNIKNSNLLLVSAKPTGNSIILHIRETSGKNGTLESKDLGNRRINSINEVSVLGNILKENITILPFEPFEVKFVQLIL